MRWKKSFGPWIVDEEDSRRGGWTLSGRPSGWWLWAIFILLLAGCGGKKPLPYTLEPRERVQGLYHVVEKGQTLWRICKAYGVSMQQVAEINDIKDVTQISTGQKIFIPGATEILKIAPYTAPVDEIQEPIPRVETFEGRFAWPVRGTLTSTFGVRNGIRHAGIDIAVPFGTVVGAAAAGEVIYAGRLRGYGKILILKHDTEYTTVYAHLNEWRVSEGQHIKQGEPIATVGDSGRSSGYHLHFEIRQNNKVRNPLFYLP
jgi:lipoprotein NlpD